MMNNVCHAMQATVHAELHKESMHYHVEQQDQSGMAQRRLLGLSAGASGLNSVRAQSKDGMPEAAAGAARSGDPS
jgi:hypothetical protein